MRSKNYVAHSLVSVLVLSLVAFIFIPLSVVQAATIRYLDPTGVDAGDCTESTPCATFGYAISISSSGDTIQVAAGTYTEDSIVIDKNLTITGVSIQDTIVQAHATQNVATNRVFLINSGVTATFNNMTVRHGKSNDGGGIRNLGTLTLERVIVTNNNGKYGGGIQNQGALTLNYSTIANNISTDGGGIQNLIPSANTIINHSIISGNTASNNGGGIVNYSCGRMATLTNSTVSANTAGNNGGGIYNQCNWSERATSCRFDLISSTIVSNTVNGQGGGIYQWSGSGPINPKSTILASQLLPAESR